MSARAAAGFAGIIGMLFGPICLAKLSNLPAKRDLVCCYRGPSQKYPVHSGEPGATWWCRKPTVSLCSAATAPRCYPRGNRPGAPQPIIPFNPITPSMHRRCWS
jgi:hypothetical protein